MVLSCLRRDGDPAGEVYLWGHLPSPWLVETWGAQDMGSIAQPSPEGWAAPVVLDKGLQEGRPGVSGVVEREAAPLAWEGDLTLG